MEPQKAKPQEVFFGGPNIDPQFPVFGRLGESFSPPGDDHTKPPPKKVIGRIARLDLLVFRRSFDPPEGHACHACLKKLNVVNWLHGNIYQAIFPL